MQNTIRNLIIAFSAVQMLAGIARAQCELYPIALSAQTLQNVAPGTFIQNIHNGAQPGNFGWLTWAGSPGEPTLVNSLTAPGDSNTYVNPANPSDNMVRIGDWVEGKPGVSNSKSVREALDNLESTVITVPVWDVAQGQGHNAWYHIVALADVQIISYRLPSQNQISAVFLGYESCGQQD
jgi:hypothetical protein